MKCSHDVLKCFKHALGKKQKRHERWQPHVLAPYVLGGPTLHLKLAVLMFLVGLFYELWRAAVAAELLWHSDDLKVRFDLSNLPKVVSADPFQDRCHRNDSWRLRGGNLPLLGFHIGSSLYPYQLRLDSYLLL